MKNLFNVDSYPNSEPAELAAGSRWAWKRSDISEAYPTAAHSLKYCFTALGSSTRKVIINASKIDEAHVVEVPISETKGVASGEYSWSAIVVRDSDNEEVAVDQGFVSVSPSQGSTDNTQAGWVYATLEAIRATIKGTASQEQQSMSFNGRSLSRRSPEELLKLEQEFSRRWNEEKRKADRKAGRSTSQRVLLKLGA